MERQDPTDEYVGHVGVDGGECAVVFGLSDRGGAMEEEEAGEGVRGEGYGGFGEGGGCWWGGWTASYG